MQNHGFNLRHVLTKYFELCQVKPGEQAVILCGESSPGMPGPWRFQDDYVQAATLAFADLGATAFQIKLPPTPKPWLPMGTTMGLVPGMGSTSLSQLPAAMEALRSVDFVFDLTFTLFSKAMSEMIEAGTRLVHLIEPPEVLVRLFPSYRLTAALERGAEMFAQGAPRTVRVTSKYGTDVSMTIGQLTSGLERGYAPDPGSWDGMPSGQVLFCPDDGATEGTFVLAPGDQVVLPFMRYVEAPVTMHVKGGFIREIEGGTDARLIREHMERWDDPDVFAIGHQSIGLHPRARWDAQAVYGYDSIGMDARIFKGAFLCGTGPNTLNGGTRTTPCHFDMIFRDASVEIDGEPIIDAGVVVAKDLDVLPSEVGFPT